jgi:hypothetical protein
MACHINDPEFARVAVAKLLSLLNENKKEMVRH